MKKQIIATALTFSLLSGATALAADSVSFSDVTQNDWAYPAISALTDQGIIAGVGNGLFVPKGSVTREQFAKMLTLTFELPVSAQPSQTFTDVTSANWSYAYVDACRDYLPGYTDASGAQQYRPHTAATREDIAAAIARAMKLQPTAEDEQYAREKFSDCDSISSDLLGYIGAACKAGLISGYPDGTFRPSASVTRAEAAAMLYRTQQQEQPADGSPIIMLTNCPESTDTAQITITGKVSNAVKLTVNGKTAHISADGTFSATLSLNSGANKITFVATSAAGKTTTEAHTISFTAERTEGQFWGYVLSDPESVRINGTTYSAFNVWDGEKTTRLNLKGSASTVTKGAIVKYTMFLDGSVYVDAMPGTLDAVTGTFEDDLYFSADPDKCFEIDDNTHILYVDTDKEVGVNGGAIDVADEPTDGHYTKNVYYYAEDTKIRCIVVDVNNEWHS